jgi:diacylglycerol O-acyltransferase / wax synthase
MPELSPIDRAFFLLETVQRPMSIGVLYLVEGSRGRGRPSDRLVRQMLRCPVGPPFDCRLSDGAWPELVVLPRVDPAEQLHRHELPVGSTLETLFSWICRIHARRLDRTRPLWEMHVFDGLPDRRVAFYFKTHHGLIDGLGFLEAIRASVSDHPDDPAPQALWRGVPNTSSGTSRPPAASRSPPKALEGWLRDGVTAGRTALDLGKLLWHVGRRDLGLGSGLPAPFLDTPNVLKAPPTPHRVMAHCALPLARVRAVARAGDAKVNDVVLATLDIALSRYLERRGMFARRPLVADMPVALHDDGGAGNRITILQVPLGRPGSPPARRLADVVRETRIVKEEVRTLSASALFLYSILSHSTASLIEALGLGELPMLANAVISNPAGIERTVYFNGARVEQALPVSVVAHHQVLNVTVSNYVDTLNVTMIALREALPDLARLAGDVTHALHDLEREVAQRRRRAHPHRHSGPRRTTGRKPGTIVAPASATLH